MDNKSEDPNNEVFVDSASGVTHVIPKRLLEANFGWEPPPLTEEQLRVTKPHKYEPPTSRAELEARYAAGERYFVGASLARENLTDFKAFRANLSHADLTDCVLHGANLKGCDLVGADLTGIQCNERTEFGYGVTPKSISRARFGGLVLSNWRLVGVEMDGVDFTSTTLSNCELSSQHFSKAGPIIDSTRFERCHLMDCVFDDLSIRNSVFDDCRLHRASFARVDLRTCAFERCELEDVSLQQARIEWETIKTTKTGAPNYLRNVKLGEVIGPHGPLSEGGLFDSKGALLWREDFTGADFRGIDFRPAGFGDTELRNSEALYQLRRRKLSGLLAAEANFANAKMEGVHLDNADLRKAIFTSASLVKANLKGANVSKADFESADLRHVEGVRFDDNNLLHARLSRDASDPWTVLRRNYTGTRFAFHLLILAAFILPYIFKAMFWGEVNSMQINSGAARAQVASVIDNAAAVAGSPLGRPKEGPIDVSTPCLAKKCDTWRNWQLLLGVDESPYAVLLAVLLIIYNTARAYLTWQVGPLRDDEERTGITPSASDYKSLEAAHNVFSRIFYVALISLAVHVSHVLVAEVDLPAAPQKTGPATLSNWFSGR